MVDVVITYETLFDVLRKEKSRDELQQLPGDFYGQLVAYLRQKRHDVEAAGGFNAPGSQKVLIQYKNVQKILRELYERRERKILEMAINRARTESNLIDRSALLQEEQDFFEKSSELLKEYKKKTTGTNSSGRAS
jgi:DNA replication initiation complex subunit (GINS family)